MRQNNNHNKKRIQKTKMEKIKKLQSLPKTTHKKQRFFDKKTNT